jgi:hypothetical protein
VCAAMGAAAGPELPAVAFEPVTLTPASFDDTVLEAADQDDDEPIEIVDDLGFDDVFEEAPVTVRTEPEVPAGDAFLTLAAVVKEVAQTFGADSSGAAKLDILLGVDESDDPAPQAVAWRGILRGESEDYEACGAATLDEWAASVVAGVVGGASKADGIRRELRRRGVAAFGLLA